jgi:acetyl esterase/lipase
MNPEINFPLKGKHHSRRPPFASCHVKALIALVLASLALSQAHATTNLNLSYANLSASEKLDLYVQDTTNGPLPLIIRIHGGAFSAGDKSSEASSVPALQARGYAVASLNYRLSGEALFPAGAQDVKAAVRWLRANAATYGIDSNRFAAWGWSAGGYFANLLGATGDQLTIFDDFSLGNSNVSSAVQAVVSWYSLTDFGTMDSQQQANPPVSCTNTWLVHNAANSPESIWLGAALPTIPAKVAQANLTNYIFTAGNLPLFSLAHGDDDCLVPWAQDVELNAALTNRGGISQLTIEPGWTHGDSRFASMLTTPALDFLDLYLNSWPTLTAQVVGGQVEISWPTTTATGYSLQWTSDLQGSNSWTAVTNAPVSSNSISSVVLPQDSSQRFFRLAK